MIKRINKNVSTNRTIYLFIGTIDEQRKQIDFFEKTLKYGWDITFTFKNGFLFEANCFEVEEYLI